VEGGAPPAPDAKTTTRDFAAAKKTHDEKLPGRKRHAKSSTIEDEAESETASFMDKVDTAVYAGAATVAVLGSVLLLRKNIKKLQAVYADAVKALAFVEDAIPQIVSAIEAVESVAQIIIKALQSTAFPPNPLHLADVFHTFKKLFSQVQAIFETFKMKTALNKAVKQLIEYSKDLTQLIAVAAYLNEACCGGNCCGLLDCCLRRNMLADAKKKK